MEGVQQFSHHRAWTDTCPHERGETRAAAPRGPSSPVAPGPAGGCRPSSSARVAFACVAVFPAMASSLVSLDRCAQQGCRRRGCAPSRPRGVSALGACYSRRTDCSFHFRNPNLALLGTSLLSQGPRGALIVGGACRFLWYHLERWYCRNVQFE